MNQEDLAARKTRREAFSNKWPHRFRHSLEILALSSLRCLYAYFLLYAIVWRPFLGSIVLVEWIIYLGLFAFYAYTDPRQWGYKRWIVITLFTIFVSTLAIIYLAHCAIFKLNFITERIMSMVGLPWYPTGIQR